MKALEGANTEARVQVAEARNRGDVGEAEKQVCTNSSARGCDQLGPKSIKFYFILQCIFFFGSLVW